MAQAWREAPRGQAAGRSSGARGRGRAARRLAERGVPARRSPRDRGGGRRRDERPGGGASGRRIRRGAASPRSLLVTAGLGFEPRLLGPEPSVLPLDDPATCRCGRGILAVARAERGRRRLVHFPAWIVQSDRVAHRLPGAVLLAELEVLEAVRVAVAEVPALGPALRGRHRLPAVVRSEEPT